MDTIDNQNTLYYFLNNNNVSSQITIHCIDFLLENYLKEDLDEESKDNLSFLVFCLLYKMQSGDVCIKLDEESFNDVIKKLKHQENNQDDFLDEADSKLNVSFILKLESFIANFDAFKACIDKLKTNDKSIVTKDLFTVDDTIYRNTKDYANKFKDEDGILHEVCNRDLCKFDMGSYSCTPLIFHNERIYLRRYFMYERNIANYLYNSKSMHFEIEQKDKLKNFVDILFDKNEDELNFQKLGALLSLRNRFSVISGGPGTGKTTTVTKLLLMQMFSRMANKDNDTLNKRKFKIILSAPTGKAAGRMSESIKNAFKYDKNIQKAMEILGSDFVQEQIPTTASTIHTLLGTKPHSASCIYNKDNKLDCDVLIVDEASMIDISLFSKLIDAISLNTTFILLGDKDQLSSVESGSVLGDICSSLNSVSDDTLDYLSSMANCSKDLLIKNKNALSDNVVLLLKSHRFKEGTIIHSFANYINKAKDLQDKDRLSIHADNIKSIINGEDRKSDFKQNRTYFCVSNDKGFNIVNKDLFLKEHQDYKVDSEISFIKQDKFIKDDTTDIFYYLNEFCNQIIELNPKIEELKELKDKKEKIYSLDELVNDVIPSCIPNKVDYKYSAFLSALYYMDFKVSADHDINLLFSLMDTFRIVCSHHKGIFGVDNLAKKIEILIKEKYDSKNKLDSFFAGKMILITRNDKSLGLNNGDVGFIAYDDKNRLMAYFKSDNNKIIKIAPTYLSFYESGFVMTVHKSQGSEYDHVVASFNFSKSPLLTKELVYTAITRAKNKVSLIYNNDSLSDAIGKSINRESGLGNYVAALSEKCI